MASNCQEWLRFTCFVGCLLVIFSCTSQPTKESASVAIQTSDSSVVDFILPQHEILDTLKGNLNGDEFIDMLLLLRQQSEINSDENLKRPLLILLGTATGYRLGTISQTAVYCFLCGGVMGDPYTGMQIESAGTFSISHYGGSNWRWTRNLTFRFDQEANDWFLIADVAESFSIFEEDIVQVDAKTPKEFGQLSFSQFDIYKE